MKTRSLVSAVAFFVGTSFLAAGPRDAAWKQVDEAAAHGLPKTAIERLDTIITTAQADQAYPEAIKAIARKAALQGLIQGDKPEERIIRFQGEVAKAPPAMRPAMDVILADWYWKYFRDNRWRFHQRTAVEGALGGDIRTWDLAGILSEIDRLYTAALADDTALKVIPIRDYDALLDKGSVPDAYRPTLFDFLAYQAIDFYQAGEQAAVVREEAFELSAEGPIFDSVSAFAHWQPETSDIASPRLKAVHLFQALLTFHQFDRERSAFFDADLARLIFGHNAAVGDDQDDRYQAALESFIKATADHPISARATAALARLINQRGNPAKARDLARHAMRAFPDTAGSAMCFNLIQEIEAKSVSLQTEHVWNEPWPTIDVTYRNVTKLYFRAVAVDFDEYLAKSRWGRGGLTPEQRMRSITAPPALEWEDTVPATKDYTQRTERRPMPKELKPGFYFIVASGNPTFSDNDNDLSATSVWVSDLALVVRLRPLDQTDGGLVLHANSGEPVAGATVRAWQPDSEGWYKPVASTQTDDSGRFTFSLGDRMTVLVAESDGQTVSSDDDIRSYHVEPEAPGTRTAFFTDRAIYRPGQTINYKGVSLRYDREAGSYAVDRDHTVTVVFSDPNGREIARATHRTNDFGSFSGEFAAPRGGLTGRMMLGTESHDGATWINVEEYKRPKFQVELPPPQNAPKLGEVVAITAKASAYTGAPINGAKVRWRVERQVTVPLWCWWWQPVPQKAIAHGTAITDSDGTFKIHYTAEPDLAVPVKNEPIFAFVIHADVTDATGETRSEQRIVRAGYTALEAALHADDWQTPASPVVFTLSTTTLNGDPQTASGTLTVYAVKQPAAVQRPAFSARRFWWQTSQGEPKPDPSNPDSWESGPIVARQPFSTDGKGHRQLSVPLASGIYRAVLEAMDPFGKTVTARQTVQVIDPSGAHYPVKIPHRIAARAWSVQPGDTFTAVWGTGYDTGRAFVELECAGKTLASYWTAPDRTQQRIDYPVSEALRGGFTVRVTYVRENRAYFNERVVQVPWSNKQLTPKWESFRSKLAPGQKETWSVVVNGPDGKPAPAEMVAALYDASLDQYEPHDWSNRFGVFRAEYSRVQSIFQNGPTWFVPIFSWLRPQQRVIEWRYREFPRSITDPPYGDDTVTLQAFQVAASPEAGFAAANTLAGSRRMSFASPAMPPGSAPALADTAEPAAVLSPTDLATATPTPDLTKAITRKNLNETAFFFPHLLADKNGLVKMVFTVPEALTEWKFLGFAHDQELRSGYLTGKAITSKDLMVEPNAPRFVREGDVIEFTAKVTNTTEAPQTGRVRLTFADAITEKPVDEALGNQVSEKPFEIPAKQSRTYSWRISIPDGLGFLVYKVVAANGRFSDGEEGPLPVLSRRVLVTESLPLPIRGQTSRQFEFQKLLESGSSTTLRQQSLTVQVTSHPAWYAVMALPYLMEYPYECSEQVFNRIYANALARQIANADPKIRRIFDQWKSTSALESPLTKNDDLKSVSLEETPWARQATAESEARRNVGLLFDANRLDEQTERGLQTLADRQLGDGLWSWFPGGRPSEYISLYIMTGFGRLRHLGVAIDTAPAVRSLGALDEWMAEKCERIHKEGHSDDYVPSPVDGLYLYGRSFFLQERPIAAQHRAAFDFFVGQARRLWIKLDCRQSQAHLALALKRLGDVTTAGAIAQSLKERSVTDEELGMFWRDTEASWWWFHAPIETQAMMIEVFDEIAHDTEAVENCRVWLLKQKQTQDWRTTKATADAVYALLLHGGDLLANDALVKLSLGGVEIRPEHTEAGTGFYEQKFVRDEVKPAMGHITLAKSDEGVSWGSVHWQYLEDMSKVTPHSGTPLQLKKTLFVKAATSSGQRLQPVRGPVAVGDELVVRIELHSDRDLEFVHLKDQRGSGTEPVDVISRYRYQDGLAYYESTRDTATHFFIDYLPKGTYVFEYSTRVQLRGGYQTGIAEIQCMYAPEFNSHSESIPLEVK